MSSESVSGAISGNGVEPLDPIRGDYAKMVQDSFGVASSNVPA